MAGSKGKEPKKRSVLEKRIQFASLALGVLAVVLGLVQQGWSLLSLGTTKVKAELETEQLRRQLAKEAQEAQRPSQVSAAVPKLKFEYLVLSREIFDRIDERRAKADKTAAEYLAYPVVDSGIAKVADSHEEPQDWIVCLIVKPFGGGAENVKLDVVRFAPANSIDILGIADRAAGSREQFLGEMKRSTGTAGQNESILIGDLDPGRGVLVPLFRLENADEGDVDQKRRAVGAILLPTVVRQRNGGGNADDATEVRAMHRAWQVESGIEIRG